MAKQSGLHQLRGKVGEYSYYRQTGIIPGLVRSINQGMSSRVKTSAEYVNTRLNNAEFGQACAIAGVLGKFVIPKYRPMVLPFSQSKMSRSLLEAIKNKTGNWGQRNLGPTDVESVIAALNLTHKNDPSEFGLVYSVSENQFVVSFNSTIFEQKLAAMGADGVDIRILACRPWIGTYSQIDGKYAKSYARANIYGGSLSPENDSVEVNYQFRPAPPTGWPATSVDFIVVVMLPYRTINDVKHTLQEYCSFEAIELPTE